MKTFVIFAIAFVLIAMVQAVPIDEADHPLLVSELTGDDIHLVTPEEMAALGFADARAARLRICIASQCNSICRSLGFRIGRCTIDAYCVCFR